MDYPLVAIGGITAENIRDILETGVDGIALVTAVTQANNPEEITKQLLETVSRYTYRSFYIVKFPATFSFTTRSVCFSAIGQFCVRICNNRMRSKKR